MGRVTSPFTQPIETTITPREWKMPSMEPYKGTSDPVIHLQRYTQHMLMSGASEGVLCKCFPLFLSDRATTWFCCLPQGTIGSWEMLKEKFISQFHIHMEQPRDAYSLSNIKQKSDESIQQYLTWFNAATATIHDVDEKLVLMALCSEVHSDTKYARRLTNEKLSTLPEVFHKAGKYMRLEDMITKRQVGQSSESVKARGGSNIITRGLNNRQGEEPKGAPQDNAGGKRKERRQYRPGPRFDAYTALNNTVMNIFLATQEELKYKHPPFKKKSEAALGISKYCRFHESHGHDTNECHHLRDLIEEYIRRRKLEQYV